MTSNTERSSAYGDARFPRRGSPEWRDRRGDRQERETRPDSDRMREMFTRAEKADARARSIRQKIEARIRELDGEIDRTDVLARSKPMTLRQKAQGYLREFQDAYRQITARFAGIRLQDSGGNLLAMNTVHEALDERFRVIRECEKDLQKWEEKVDLPVTPDTAEWQPGPEPAPEVRPPEVRLYPYGWRDGQGQQGRNGSIILSFSTGWGRNQRALHSVAGSSGAMNLGLRQSIMLGNIQGSDPFSRRGSETGFGAGGREAVQMENQRRALAEVGVHVAQTSDGTRIEITYVPDGEYIEINGEKIWGPIGLQPGPASIDSSSRSRTPPARETSAGKELERGHKSVLERVAEIAGRDAGVRRDCIKLKQDINDGTFRWGYSFLRAVDENIRSLARQEGVDNRAMDRAAPRNPQQLVRFIDMVLAQGEPSPEVSEGVRDSSSSATTTTTPKASAAEPSRTTRASIDRRPPAAPSRPAPVRAAPSAASATAPARSVPPAAPAPPTRSGGPAAAPAAPVPGPAAPKSMSKPDETDQRILDYFNDNTVVVRGGTVDLTRGGRIGKDVPLPEGITTIKGNIRFTDASDVANVSLPKSLRKVEGSVDFDYPAGGVPHIPDGLEITGDVRWKENPGTGGRPVSERLSYGILAALNRGTVRGKIIIADIGQEAFDQLKQEFPKLASQMRQERSPAPAPSPKSPAAPTPLTTEPKLPAPTPPTSRGSGTGGAKGGGTDSAPASSGAKSVETPPARPAAPASAPAEASAKPAEARVETLDGKKFSDLVTWETTSEQKPGLAEKWKAFLDSRATPDLLKVLDGLRKATENNVLLKAMCQQTYVGLQCYVDGRDIKHNPNIGTEAERWAQAMEQRLAQELDVWNVWRSLKLVAMPGIGPVPEADYRAIRDALRDLDTSHYPALRGRPIVFANADGKPNQSSIRLKLGHTAQEIQRIIKEWCSAPMRALERRAEHIGTTHHIDVQMSDAARETIKDADINKLQSVLTWLSETQLKVLQEKKVMFWSENGLPTDRELFIKPGQKQEDVRKLVEAWIKAHTPAPAPAPPAAAAPAKPPSSDGGATKGGGSPTEKAAGPAPADPPAPVKASSGGDGAAKGSGGSTEKSTGSTPPKVEGGATTDKQPTGTSPKSAQASEKPAPKPEDTAEKLKKALEEANTSLQQYDITLTNIFEVALTVEHVEAVKDAILNKLTPVQRVALKGRSVYFYNIDGGPHEDTIYIKPGKSPDDVKTFIAAWINAPVRAVEQRIGEISTKLGITVTLGSDTSLRETIQVSDVELLATVLATVLRFLDDKQKDILKTAGVCFWQSNGKESEDTLYIKPGQKQEDVRKLVEAWIKAHTPAPAPVPPPPAAAPAKPPSSDGGATKGGGSPIEKAAGPAPEAKPASSTPDKPAPKLAKKTEPPAPAKPTESREKQREALYSQVDTFLHSLKLPEGHTIGRIQKMEDRSHGTFSAQWQIEPYREDECCFNFDGERISVVANDPFATTQKKYEARFPLSAAEKTKLEEELKKLYSPTTAPKPAEKPAESPADRFDTFLRRVAPRELTVAQKKTDSTAQQEERTYWEMTKDGKRVGTASLITTNSNSVIICLHREGQGSAVHNPLNGVYSGEYPAALDDANQKNKFEAALQALSKESPKAEEKVDQLTGAQMIEWFDRLDLTKNVPSQQELQRYLQAFENKPGAAVTSRMSENDRNAIWDKAHVVDEYFSRQESRKVAPKTVRDFLDAILKTDHRRVGEEIPEAGQPNQAPEKETGAKVLALFDKLDLARQVPTQKKMEEFRKAFDAVMQTGSGLMTEQELQALFDKAHAVQKSFQDRSQSPTSSVSDLLLWILNNDLSAVGRSRAPKKTAPIPKQTPSSPDTLPLGIVDSITVGGVTVEKVTEKGETLVRVGTTDYRVKWLAFTPKVTKVERVSGGFIAFTGQVGKGRFILSGTFSMSEAELGRIAQQLAQKNTTQQIEVLYKNKDGKAGTKRITFEKVPTVPASAVKQKPVSKASDQPAPLEVDAPQPGTVPPPQEIKETPPADQLHALLQSLSQSDGITVRREEEAFGGRWSVKQNGKKLGEVTLTLNGTVEVRREGPADGKIEFECSLDDARGVRITDLEEAIKRLAETRPKPAPAPRPAAVEAPAAAPEAMTGLPAIVSELRTALQTKAPNSPEVKAIVKRFNELAQANLKKVRDAAIAKQGKENLMGFLGVTTDEALFNKMDNLHRTDIETKLKTLLSDPLVHDGKKYDLIFIKDDGFTLAKHAL